MIQSGGFLRRLLGPLLKTGLPLINNVIKPLTKSVLIPLKLTAAASAADARIHKKILRSSCRHSSSSALSNSPLSSVLHINAMLIISNDEIKHIIKMTESLKDSSLLPERVSETIPNEAKKQTAGFLNMLLGTLGANLLGNIVTGKAAIAKSVSQETKSKRQTRSRNKKSLRRNRKSWLWI